MEIICPICKNKLFKKFNSYYCINNHCFDIAKEGYLNLYLKSAKKSGDEKEMIQAREDFLNKDYYLFLKEELNRILKELKINSLLDLGCGEGYYTSYFNIEEKIGIDLSQEALKKASKKDPKSFYILSSIFNNPIATNSIDAILTCFAPIAYEEINRICKKDGYFILVRPNVKHLYELKEVVYTNPYDNELEEIKLNNFEIINEYSISNHSILDKQDILNLFKMTPYYHKTSMNDMNKLLEVNQLDITFDFIISIYKKS